MSLMDLDSTPIGWIFPGQGSQTVGMGKELYERSQVARRVFDLADETLGISLTELCFSGPADELNDTFNAQPALLTASIAALQDVRDRAHEQEVALDPRVTAGHSLGEFTALVAADAIDFVPALELVRERGRLMKAAGEESPGGMAAIIGMELEDLERVVDTASERGLVLVANANSPGQIVISGDDSGLEQAMTLAKEQGARKVIRLPVTIASHSPLMKDASRALRQHLDSLELRDPSLPVIANASAQPITTADGLREELSQHMEQPVDWIGTMNAIQAMGVNTVVELGAGAVLAGLNRRIDRSIVTVTSDNLD